MFDNNSKRRESNTDNSKIHTRYLPASYTNFCGWRDPSFCNNLCLAYGKLVIRVLPGLYIAPLPPSRSRVVGSGEANGVYPVGNLRTHVW